MNRTEKRRKYNAEEVEILKQLEYHKGMNYATKCLYASTLLILHDKFDFTSKQCQDFLSNVEDQTDSIVKGYISYDEIAKIIYDELDITIVEEKK